MAPRVAVLHHAESFFPLTLADWVGDAFELVWVVDAPLSGDDATVRLLRKLGPVVDVSGLDTDSAAARLRDQRVDGVVSFCEETIEVAAALAARLGLPFHTPEVAAAVVDKLHQRECFREAGIPQPDFWPAPAGASPEEAEALVGRVTYPAVVKPTAGSRSRGVRRVDSPGELRHLLSGAVGRTGHVVEAYLSDDVPPGRWYASYLSVESVVSRGRVSHVAVTGRFPLAEPFRESGNFIPAILEPRVRASVLAMAEDAVRSLGITDSVVHVEVKLTPDGPRLVEVNGRLAGRPPFVLGSVSDVNLFRVACQVAVGDPVVFEGLVECRGVGFWLMLQPPMAARSVEAVHGGADLVDLDGVDSTVITRGPGSTVDWREGTSTHVAVVRGRVGDDRALADVVAAVHRTVTTEFGY